jgi:hypothetical protein
MKRNPSREKPDNKYFLAEKGAKKGANQSKYQAFFCLNLCSLCGKVLSKQKLSRRILR